MYKHRRLTQATLPRAPSNADTIVYEAAKLNGDDFCRGYADDGEDETALLFASTEQLNVLKVAKEVEHSNSGKKSFDSIRLSLPIRFFFDLIRFDNLINFPLVGPYTDIQIVS